MNWREDLTKLGFVSDGGTNRYRRGGLIFDTDDRWSELRATNGSPPPAPLREPLGTPGLWKWVADRRVFDLPPAVIAPAEDEFGATTTPLGGCLEWALQTAAGKLPEGWQTPDRVEVESWIPRAGLTVQFGRVVRQGTLHHASGRLALRFPILPRVPADLSPNKHMWLEEILMDGQSRSRLVRIAFTTNGSVEAEVDLSGAPHAVIENLFRTGLESLRWIVEWLEPVDFLVDAGAACRAFEVCPVREQPAERSQ